MRMMIAAPRTIDICIIAPEIIYFRTNVYVNTGGSFVRNGVRYDGSSGGSNINYECAFWGDFNLDGYYLSFELINKFLYH